MKAYILDETLMGITTYYTGEELIVYPVELNIFELIKLKKIGINYTTDAYEVGNWIKEHEYTNGKNYGGIIIKYPTKKSTIKLDIDWNKISEIKENSIKSIEKVKTR